MCKAKRTRLLRDGHGTATYLIDLLCEESEAHEQHYDYSFNQGWHDDEEEPELDAAPNKASGVWPGAFPWYG